MKRKIFIPILLVAAILISTFGFAPASAAQPKAATKNNANPEKVMLAKIENILNLNNVFDDDFTDNEILVNKACVNLKSYADEEGFIPEGVITAYVKDMYDIDLVITDDINPDMPKKAGFVYLMPKGYTAFKHNIISVTDNGGYITVNSAVSVNYHDGEEVIGSAETILVKNPASSFGYNIINSSVTYNGDLLLQA